jgi:two-component system chemotaxis response regulator CheY
MGGIELLEKVRQDPELKAIPFIIMTEAADKKKIMEAIRAGTDNFVIKPFTIEAMKWSIKKIAEKKKLYRQAGRNLLFQDT